MRWKGASKQKTAFKYDTKFVQTPRRAERGVAVSQTTHRTMNWSAREHLSKFLAPVQDNLNLNLNPELLEFKFEFEFASDF